MQNPFVSKVSLHWWYRLKTGCQIDFKVCKQTGGMAGAAELKELIASNANQMTGWALGALPLCVLENCVCRCRRVN